MPLSGGILMRNRAASIVLSLLLLVALAACGSSGGSSATPADGGMLTVGQAWARAKEAAGTSAAYMTITNGTFTDEVLVGVSAPTVTNMASLHETTTDASGMTAMQHTDSITIPAGKTVTLEPGGYHVMLMELLKDLKAGDKVDLVLTFEQAGPVPVTADVRTD